MYISRMKHFKMFFSTAHFSKASIQKECWFAFITYSNCSFVSRLLWRFLFLQLLLPAFIFHTAHISLFSVTGKL